MTVHNSTDALAAEMLAIGAAARDAARAMREASDEAKTKALHVAAAAIRSRAAEILAANKGDIEAAKAANMPAPMVDRLMLNDARIEAMAKAIEDVAALARSGGARTGALVAAQWAGYRPRRHAHRRDRHHL